MNVSLRNPRLIAVATAAALAAVALGALTAQAGEARKGKLVLGQTPSTPKPVCPTPPDPDGDGPEGPPADKVCNVLGRVTGFQTMADGRKNPYKVRKPGKIVAWSVSLGRPSKEEEEFFLNELSNSGPASARLAVLKPQDDGRLKLTKQSPPVELKPYFKEQPIFTLGDPLRVKKGVIIAVTTPTWIPNLALRGASQSDEWRASRPEGECEGEENLLQKSRPHQKVGGTRAYDCSYRSTRILYSAFIDTGSRDR